MYVTIPILHHKIYFFVRILFKNKNKISRYFIKFVVNLCINNKHIQMQIVSF